MLSDGSRELEIESLLMKLNENFFTEDKVRVIRYQKILPDQQVKKSKLMKGLVHMIYAFVCVAIDLERNFSLDNLLQITETPNIRNDEVRLIVQTGLAQNSHKDKQ